ncbi:hypothetical protein [Natronorarus salvus]|uniref:hypothetical protein n=1 Tax=Natronorarus salvus TaxID=3117733 RepID=UPI002F26AF3E
MTDACVEERERVEPVEDDERGERDDGHLRDVPVGAGCTEIWEHLSERREE